MNKNLVLKLGNNFTENTPKYEIDFQVSMKETSLIPERNKYEKLLIPIKMSLDLPVPGTSFCFLFDIGYFPSSMEQRK